MTDLLPFLLQEIESRLAGVESITSQGAKYLAKDTGSNLDGLLLKAQRYRVTLARTAQDTSPDLVMIKAMGRYHGLISEGKTLDEIYDILMDENEYYSSTPELKAMFSVDTMLREELERREQ